MTEFTDIDRKLYFLGGCIPVRLAIAYLVYHVDTKKKKSVVDKTYAVWFLLLVSIGLLFSYVKRMMEPEQDHKGFFGSEVYWNSSVHSLMYAISAFMLDGGYSYPWLPLVLDVMIGFGTFYHRYFQ